MNDSVSIGEVVKLIRINNNLSQEQLANLINVTRPVITNIESGKRNPTDEQLFDLSNKLEFDLVHFEHKIKPYKNLEHYLLAYRLNRLIDSGDYISIVNILEYNPTIKEFDYGEAAFIKTYYEAFTAYLVKRDFDLVYELCRKFFNVDKDNIENLKIKINMPEKYYGFVVLYACYFYDIGDYATSLLAQRKLLDFFNKTYFRNDLPSIEVNSFLKKYYIKTYLNIAELYFVNGDYEAALDFCEKSNIKSRQLNNLSVLSRIAKQKVVILYMMNRLADAKETYKDYEAICRLTDGMKYFEITTVEYKEKYPLLFE